MIIKGDDDLKDDEMEIEEIKLFRDTDLNNIQDIIETMEKHKHVTKWTDNFMSDSGCSNYRVEIKRLKD